METFLENPGIHQHIPWHHHIYWGYLFGFPVLVPGFGRNRHYARSVDILLCVYGLAILFPDLVNRHVGKYLAFPDKDDFIQNIFNIRNQVSGKKNACILVVIGNNRF